VSICIVVPAYNEADSLKECCQQIAKAMKKFPDYSILLVDDGSTDDTLKIIKRLAADDKHISYLSFARNFGHQAALRAGIVHSVADAIITMDADLQHPPRLLPELIKYWQEGNDIVYTRRKSGPETSVFKRLSSRWFYRVLNRLSGLTIDEGAADFRLIDARVAQVVRDLPEPNLFLRGFMSWVGFRVYALEYTPDARFAGTSKYSLGKMLTLALHGVTQFSMKPLRLANILGSVSVLLGLVYGCYAVWDRVVSHNAISGWTSVIVTILIMGGVQLVMLGIIGEYIGRTFVQTKQRPDYIIKEKG